MFKAAGRQAIVEVGTATILLRIHPSRNHWAFKFEATPREKAMHSTPILTFH